MHHSVQHGSIVIQKLPLLLLFSTLHASRHGTSWRALFEMLSREQCHIEEVDVRKQNETLHRATHILDLLVKA
jgi:hypothetical protein